jgi:hypothetical protein
MGKVAETVKLSAALSVEFVFVVVRHYRYKSLDFVLEWLAPECRYKRHIQWKC